MDWQKFDIFDIIFNVKMLYIYFKILMLKSVSSDDYKFTLNSIMVG